MVNVILSPLDILHCQQYAAERQRLKDNVGVPDGKKLKQFDGESVHLIGLYGEFAIARHLNLAPHQIHGEAGIGGDNSLYDYIINGKTAEVKTTIRPYRNFGITKPTDFTWNYVFLVWLMDTIYNGLLHLKIVGFITLDDFIERWDYLDFGGTTVAGVRWQSFNPMSEFSREG